MNYLQKKMIILIENIINPKNQIKKVRKAGKNKKNQKEKQKGYNWKINNSKRKSKK